MINIDELTLGQIKQLRDILGVHGEPARPVEIANCDPSQGTYVIVRGRDIGVHAGEFVAHPADRTVVLRNSRRLWYWKGAASLSELAVYGAKNVSDCRFGVLIVEPILRPSAKEVARTGDGYGYGGGSGDGYGDGYGYGSGSGSGDGDGDGYGGGSG
jgi:hypothetical protein